MAEAFGVNLDLNPASASRAQCPKHAVRDNEVIDTALINAQIIHCTGDQKRLAILGCRRDFRFGNRIWAGARHSGYRLHLC